jgi:acetyl-CoA carboxylase biotin carboxylase subunit
LFRRLLIANRGEIAVRIARACREAGIAAVAVHAEDDASSLHVRVADEAIPLPGATPSGTYLNIAAILEAARRGRCDAVHPGYGFLAENAEFARAVRAAGLAFIGPGAEAIRLMGDKVRAREAARGAGVPVMPGYDGGGSAAEYQKQAAKIGFPILVKAVGGGGGRGMRVAASKKELPEALESARREAAGAFADPRVFLERYLPAARHVEVQVLGDGEGRVISLFERDCSIQRRHQKVLEESPSPALTEELRGHICRAAEAVAASAGYSNAGTVEFLLDADSGEFHFLEMNTRLQVEHPVTEAISGVDLVLAQLRLADGEPIDPSWAGAAARGHAVECRLCAEDPRRDFVPSPGPILAWSMPSGPGVRVDAGYEQGDEVPVSYDSLLAKIVVWGEDRAAALQRMDAALRETAVLGPAVNLSFLKRLVAHPDFRRGAAGTDFLARTPLQQAAVDPPPDEAVIAAALLLAERRPGAPARRGGEAEGEGERSPWNRRDGFRIGG